MSTVEQYCQNSTKGRENLDQYKASA